MGRMTHEGTRVRAHTSHATGVTAGMCVVTHACAHSHQRMCVHVCRHEDSRALTGSHTPATATTASHAGMRAGSPLGSYVYAHAGRGGHTRAGLVPYNSVQFTTHRLETLSNILS